MGDCQSLCLVGAMDRLWFHETILFSEHFPHRTPRNLKPNQPISKTLSYQPTSLSLPPLPDKEETPSPASSPDDSNIEEDDLVINQKERPKRLNLGQEKSVNCESFGELELEELKGFMDLAFMFEEEHLTPRIGNLVPGFQRLRLSRNKQGLITAAIDESVKDDRNMDEEEKREALRPYLSEAWLIKRPDSPPLNLRVPSVSADDDMKRRIRFWAKTVASAVQRESWFLCSPFIATLWESFHLDGEKMEKFIKHKMERKLKVENYTAK